MIKMVTNSLGYWPNKNQGIVHLSLFWCLKSRLWFLYISGVDTKWFPWLLWELILTFQTKGGWVTSLQNRDYFIFTMYQKKGKLKHSVWARTFKKFTCLWDCMELHTLKKIILYCICTFKIVCIHIKLKRLWFVSHICCSLFPATFFYWPGDQWVRKLMVFPRSWGSLPHYGIAFTRNKSQRQILCYLTFPWSHTLCRRSGLNPSSLVSGIFFHEP